MGLAEKRAMKEAETKWLAKRNAELQQISGGALSYEIEWESFADDAKAIEWLESNGPQQVAMAFRQICKDELGKEAIQEAINKVVLRYVADPEARDVECAEGVLSIQGTFSQGIKGTVRDKQIRECVEAAL